MKSAAVKKILSGILAAGLMIQAFIPVSAQEKQVPSGDGILFEDKFDSGILDQGWEKNEKGEYIFVEDEAGYDLNMRGDPWDAGLTVNTDKAEWFDYSIEMEFTINDWIGANQEMAPYDNIGIAGRIQNNNRIAMYYRRASQKLELNKFYSNAGHSLVEVEYPLEEKTAYQMKLEFSGNDVSGYIAPAGGEFGEPVIQWTDDGNSGQALEYGGCGIENGGCDVTIRYFRVTGTEKLIPVEKVMIREDSVTLEQGEQHPLSVEIEPENASDKSVIWSSSDDLVASVDEYGTVTAKSSGTAVITATAASDESRSDSCTVEVYESAECENFYYVSPDGSDENEGTIEKPFRTIQKARDTIRALEGEIPKGGITVYLREGEYFQDTAVEFTPEDSGKAGSPIIYTSYPGEKAVITGGKEIEGWKPLEEEIPYMAEEARGNLYVADIEKGWRFHDLYVNGERQQIAQQMETKQFRTWPQFSGAIGEEDSKFLELDPERGIKVRFNEGELDGLTGNPDIEINCMTVMFWNTLPILTDINEEDNTAWLYSYNPGNLGDEQTSFNTKEGGWYNILNDIKYLDRPGEWVVNSVEGKVYYWPEDEDFTSQKVVAPGTHELVRFQGDEEEQNWENLVEYIVLDNLYFEYNDRLPEDQFDQYEVIRNSESPDGAIFLSGTENCRISNCVIRHSGAYAVTLNHYAQNNEISGNTMQDLGGGGVNFVGYGPGKVDLNKNNKVLYNSIRDLGNAYLHTAGVSIYQSGENLISYNYISEAPYTGVTIVGEVAVGFNTDTFSAAWDFFGDMNRQYGFRWQDLEPSKPYTREEVKVFVHSRNNTVRYNIIDEYMNGLEDGGGLYAWGCGNGNRYEDNIIIKTEKGMHWTFPLYMDDGVDYITVSGNRIWSVEQGTIDKGYGTNTWSDNEFSWPEKPEGYEELKTHILDTIEENTGKTIQSGVGEAVLQAPEDQAEGIPQPFEMAWGAAENTQRYRVEVAADPEFEEIVFSEITEDTRIDGPDLDWGQTYYWRVGSCIMAEPVVYSEIRSFTMMDGASVIMRNGIDYTDEEGTQIEDGYLAYIDDGDWAEYQITIPEAGKYTLNYKVAVNESAGAVEFVSDGEVLAETELPGTGGWQNWTRVSDTVEFKTAGEKTVRLNVIAGGWNLDKFELIKSESSADKTLLQKTVEYAETLNTDGVTDTAKAYFEKVLAEAQSVLADASATQEKVNAAWNNLLEGIWGLGIVQGDKTNLELLIARAEAMIADVDRYVQTNWQTLVDELADAKAVFEDGDALDEDVTAAAEELLDAILMQRYKANKENLQNLVDSLKDLDLSRYTAESTAVYKAALAQAQAVLADENLSVDDQAVVDQAEKRLTDARDGLVAAAEENPGEPADPGDNSDLDNENSGTGGSDNQSGSGVQNGSDSGKAVQTGDDTPFAGTVAVMIAAVALAGGIARRKFRG